ncbi:MAG TPA: multidrug effflux MFS transporter [Steroidobacteraceae bacterium]|jgi:DHA1 family bicyclomycin/chloramphenicol resistance-like MFS transporter
MMGKSYLREGIILGLLSAIGPFAIDMYLPALPSIGQSLHANAATVQLSLTVFFIAVGGGQLLYGPLSDMYGRKLPLYVGLVLFCLGSVTCALAPSAELFLLGRFVQGLGACGGMVIPRAVVRDLHSGVEATRLMSLLMLVFSISPLLAPLTGSFVIQFSSWRGVFWMVLGAAIIGFGVLTTLKESRPVSARAGSSMVSAFHSYRQLLGDRHFIGTVLIGTCGMASFFLYLSNSPYVMIEHYHLSPRGFSLLFSVNAASFFVAAQFNAALATRIGLKALVRRASTGFAVAMLLLLSLFAAGVDHLVVMVTLLCCAYACLGMTVPTATILALEEHGAIAGTASSLIGTLQFGFGSLVMGLTGTFANGAPLPMIAGITLCAVACAGFARITLRHSADTAVAAA